jgi:hypothetical protein
MVVLTGCAPWRLQSQTDPPHAGLSSKWVASTSGCPTNQITLAIDLALGSVFFRLVFP